MDGNLSKARWGEDEGGEDGLGVRRLQILAATEFQAGLLWDLRGQREVEGDT